MRAILLAGGYGTRLRPITNSIPKCLVPINGKPLLDYWLENLSRSGFQSFLINTHHLAEQVKEYSIKSVYKDCIELIHEDVLLGTAGTLRENISFFGNQDGLLAHADNYCLADFSEFIEAHKQRPKECLVTMMTFQTKTPESCGILELNENGIVTAFHEKVKNPPGNIANGAIYILSKNFLRLFENDFKSAKDFSIDVIPYLMGKIFTYHTSAELIDIGDINTYHSVSNNSLI